MSPAPEISTGEALASRTGEVEVVEHVHEGAFDRVAAQDSFAMDDATADDGIADDGTAGEPNPKLDPRFVRAMNGIEPATELLDREMLAAIASATTMPEDELAEALRLPGESGGIPAEPKTEKVSRAALAAALLDEVTVPTPLPVAGELSDAPPDLTLPMPIKSIPQPPTPSPPVSPPAQMPAIQQALSPTGSLPLSGTQAVGQAESNRPSTPSQAPARLPSRPRATAPSVAPSAALEGAPVASGGSAEPVQPIRSETANNLSTPRPAGSVQPVPASQAPTATLKPEPRESSQSSLVDGDTVPLPLVGLVVAGSSGIVAFVVAAVVAIAVLLVVLLWSRASEEAEEPQSLPPIEIVPVEAPPPAQTTPEPAQDPEEPEAPRPRRPQAAPAPAPAPEPVPVLAPAPEPELPPDELDLPEPEPEKRGGLFGKKKKN